MSATSEGSEVESTNHKEDKLPVIHIISRHEDDATQNAGSRNFCQRLFSPNIKNLLHQMFQLSWAVVLGNFFTFLCNTQSLIFCGSLGATELAAGSLSNTIVMIFGVSIALGMSTALDTLSAQAYGAKNFRMVGIVLQRGVFILSLAVIVVCAFWMLTQHFLLLIGFDSHIAKSNSLFCSAFFLFCFSLYPNWKLAANLAIRMADMFIMIMLPMVPAEFLAQLLIKYLQTQGIVRPLVLIGFLTNLCALGLFFLIVKYLEQGFRGVPIALMLVSYIRVFMILLYIKISKVHKKTWTGWSTECLYGWKQFLSLSLPGLLMICMEWWTFEIATFILGSFGEIVVATHGILLQLTMLVFMLPHGISIAAGVLVGNFLGANNPAQAKTVTKLSLVMGLMCTSIVALLVVTCRKYIAMAFSDNENVINLLVTTLPLMAVLFIEDAVQGVCSGVIRGCGRQKIGMIVNFISHDLFAIPLGVVFAFVLDLQLLGVWWGICIGLFIQAALYIILLSCTKWDKQAQLAMKRTSKGRGQELKPLNKTPNSIAKEELLVNDSKQETNCDGNQPNEKCSNGDACLLREQETDHTSAIVIEDLDKRDHRHSTSARKLLLLRFIPFFIAILFLCVTISIRYLVPLPHASTKSLARNQTIVANGTSLNI